MKVGVIDYGVGNLGSMLRALEHLRVTSVLVNHASHLHTNDCLILPGVGNFADCVHLLNNSGWIAALQDEVLGRMRPILGVCLGMQLLADSSTEGTSEGEPTSGLGFISGQVRHLNSIGCNQRVPHVGWNSITYKNRVEPLFEGIPDGTDFYFVHSYAFVPKSCASVIATTNYGTPIAAAIRCGHVWGTQFHPEKSSRAGFRLLRNFIQAALC
jgi:glutamine amidotransferase